MAKGDLQAILNSTGIDAICEWLVDGDSQRAIAEKLGVPPSTLSEWIAADAERSARAREARTVAARTWDDMAEAEIREAKDAFSLSRAKELAHHYRWRASKANPKEYGEKVTAEIGGIDGKPIEHSHTVSDATGRLLADLSGIGANRQPAPPVQD